MDGIERPLSAKNKLLDKDELTENATTQNI